MNRLLLALLIVSLTACSTVTHGPMQRIVVDSNPAGATVKAEACGAPRSETVTPATVWVSRRAKRCTFILSHPDYMHPESVRLERKLADRFMENARAIDVACEAGVSDCNGTSDVVDALFIGGIVTGTGMGIDALTGAMYHQDPPEVWVDFTYQKP